MSRENVVAEKMLEQNLDRAKEVTCRPFWSQAQSQGLHRVKEVMCLSEIDHSGPGHSHIPRPKSKAGMESAVLEQSVRDNRKREVPQMPRTNYTG